MPLPTFLDKPMYEVKLEIQRVCVIKLLGKPLQISKQGVNDLG